MSSLTIRSIMLALLLFAAGVLIFARAMERDLNHDEHQFLAPGALIAQRNALPYRDYPLFHMPNLVGIYSDLFIMEGSYIFQAKMVSVAAAFLIVAMLLSRTVLNAKPMGVWFAGCVGVVALLLFDPLWLRTTGKTWNHEVSAAFAVAACVFHGLTLERGGMLRWGVGGALLSLGIGTRLTVAPLALAFIGSLWLVPMTRKERASCFAAFCIGGVLAGLPVLYCFVKSPAAFVFGNLEFPRLRLLDPTDERARDTAALWRKARYFLREVIRPGWALFVVFALIAARPAWRALRGRDQQPVLAFMLLAVIGAVIGSGMPTRYQYQHWFLVTPIAALAIAEAWTRAATDRVPRWVHPAAAACVLIALARSAGEYSSIRDLTDSSQWFPMRFAAQAEALRAQVGKARVLTLAPALATEARLEIYPEFATGPFAWRLAHLLPPERRARFHIVAPEDLEDFLRAAPPDAILTGFEDEDLEAPLVEWAKSRQYIGREFGRKRMLWMPEED